MGRDYRNSNSAYLLLVENGQWVSWTRKSLFHHHGMLPERCYKYSMVFVEQSNLNIWIDTMF